MNRRPYDPGQPGRIEKVGPGIYRVWSWREPTLPPYLADIHNVTCTCPHFEKRGELCKHLMQADEQNLAECIEIAGKLKMSQVIEQLKKPDLKHNAKRALESVKSKLLAA